MKSVAVLKSILVCYFCLIIKAQAQPAGVDSLKRQLARKLPDTSRVNLLLTISDSFFQASLPKYNPDSALYYAKQALELSRKISYMRGEARSYMQLAIVTYDIGDYAPALGHIQQSLKRFESLKDTLGIIRSLRMFSAVYNFRGNDRQMLSNYLSIVRLARKINNKEQLIKTFAQISLAYTQSTILNLDSAEYYADQVLRSGVNLQWERAEALGIKGDVYAQRKAYPRALAYMRQALQGFKKANDQHRVYDTYVSLGKTYGKLNRLDSALYYSKLAYQQYKGDLDSLTMKMEAGYQLGLLYRDLKQFEQAAKFFKIAADALAAIDEKGEKQKFIDLEYREKQRQLELQAAIAEYDSRIRFYAVLGGLLLISAVSLILFRNNRQKHKANTLLQQQRDEINEQHNQLQESLEKLRATQAQLIQQEKLASLGELTAGIAHEIQNPLNFVNNFSDVSVELLEELKEELAKGDTEEAGYITDDVIQNLQKIHHHGKRAESIVKSMLEHSRTTSGEKRPTDLNALTDEYLRLAYHGIRSKDKSFNATLHTDYAATLPQLTVAPQEFGRVLLNLFNNAFYALREKQKHADSDYQPQVWISTEIVEGKVQLRVKDNGTGIPSEIINKIYQPFFTTKPTGQGTGLGLSLSYDIVTKGYGGEIASGSVHRVRRKYSGKGK
jgi:signal transduction histidine kinase